MYPLLLGKDERPLIWSQIEGQEKVKRVVDANRELPVNPPLHANGKVPHPWRNIYIHFVHVHDENDGTHSRKERIQLRIIPSDAPPQPHKYRRNWSSPGHLRCNP